MTNNSFLIWSFEHDAWWGPARWGYTRERAWAGHYTREEADAILAAANLITVNECAVAHEDSAAFRPASSIVCPRCRRRSFNANDIAERYCGACHRFHEDV